ncbi:MAG: FeoA family protein [Anaerolineae bacterium]
MRLLPLSALCPNQTALVQCVEGGHGVRGRLASLGFTPGAEVHMIQNYGRGPLIVEVRGARVALGRREAMRVLVEPTAPLKR